MAEPEARRRSPPDRFRCRMTFRSYLVRPAKDSHEAARCCRFLVPLQQIAEIRLAADAWRRQVPSHVRLARQRLNRGDEGTVGAPAEGTGPHPPIADRRVGTSRECPSSVGLLPAPWCRPMTRAACREGGQTITEMVTCHGPCHRRGVLHVGDCLAAVPVESPCADAVTGASRLAPVGTRDPRGRVQDVQTFPPPRYTLCHAIQTPTIRNSTSIGLVIRSSKPRKRKVGNKPEANSPIGSRSRKSPMVKTR